MPKIVDHDQYRKELLHKAFDLFAERGYGSLTMRQLAQGLGVSTGVLYHYFKSKEELFVRLMESLAEQDALEIEQVLSGSSDTLEGRIAAVFDWIAAREDVYIKQIMLSISFYQEHHQGKELMDSSEVIAQINEKYRDLCQKYLGVTDPTLMEFIDSLIAGITLNRLYFPDQISWDDQAKLLSQMLRLYLTQNPQFLSKEMSHDLSLASV